MVKMRVMSWYDARIRRLGLAAYNQLNCIQDLPALHIFNPSSQTPRIVRVKEGGSPGKNVSTRESLLWHFWFQRTHMVITTDNWIVSRDCLIFFSEGTTRGGTSKHPPFLSWIRSC